MTLWTTKYQAQSSPFGVLDVDTDLKDLLQLPSLPSGDDESEHSIEMMFPFIAYLMQDFKIPIFPIYVNDVRKRDMAVVRKIWNHSNSTAFIFSSDFCHWGRRFKYCRMSSKTTDPIHMQIETLDMLGMQILQRFSLEEWDAYLQKYGNTICGRVPLMLFISLGSFLSNSHNALLEWIRYGQSSKVLSPSESSVSYAAGSLIIKRP